jgi:outer membrane protein TolC
MGSVEAPLRTELVLRPTMNARRRKWNARPAWLVCLLLGGCVPGCVPGSPFWLAYPEQRHLDIREPRQMPQAPLPEVPAPATVASPAPKVPPEELSLDKAIEFALGNSQAVRVLNGVAATASGQTIYDAAISNTQIDVQRGVFDPTLTLKNAVNRFDRPAPIFDPRSPIGVSIPHAETDQYTLSAILSKKTLVGGTFSVDGEYTWTHFPPSPFSSTTGIAAVSPLNPLAQSSVTMSYTQPVLRGAGLAANLAPIVIARVNTELSFFQYKDAIQEEVRGVVEAYWAVVFARTDLWVKQQQVEQNKFAYDLAEARLRSGIGDAATTAQAKSSLATFKAALVGAEANLLQREGALRNIMRLPPTVPERLTLTTPATQLRIEPRWEEILKLAGEQRPDLIEFRLQIEADQQNWIIANNNARPQLDLVTFYRMNGADGQTPFGAHLSTEPGQFFDWSAGINLSMPLGLRADRAKLRSAELTIVRDKANLAQGMHNAIHILATNVRNIAQYYAQFQAYREARAAARENLDAQLAAFKANRVIYLNVLQAIADWGNAISSEAQALAQYNTELANLERQTGTILQTHGVHFFEERYGSIGPCGRCAPPARYPADIPPTPNTPVYPPGTEPAEKALEKERPRIPGSEESPRLGDPVPNVLPTLPAPRPFMLPPLPGKE